MTPPEASPDAAMMSLGLLLALLGGVVLLMSLPLIALVRMRRRSKIDPRRSASPKSPLDPWHEGGRRRGSQALAEDPGEDDVEGEDQDA
ncbi:MAG: hypothetical protein P8J59_05745 [Phycisphaerales bacterium]|jgi:hypothetical protein|nr:hypothetical protein [Phycisphaerales bacterium]